MDNSDLIPAAAVLLGFFAGWGLGPAAGFAAGLLLDAAYGAWVGTAEDVLKLGANDVISTLLLLLIYGAGWLGGLAAKSLYDNS